MKLNMIILLRLIHYKKVIQLMTWISENITCKESYELSTYWLEVYRNKITFLLRKKSKELG